MGNQLKKAGVKPGVQIDMQLFETMWDKADKNNTGHLSKSEALKFLENFSHIIKCPYNTKNAEALLEFCGGGPKGVNGLNKDMFAFVLTKECEFGQFSLSTSVEKLSAQASAAQFTKSGVNQGLMTEFENLRKSSSSALDMSNYFDKVSNEWQRAGNTEQAESASKLADYNRDISESLNTHLFQLRELSSALISKSGMTSAEVTELNKGIYGSAPQQAAAPAQSAKAEQSKIDQPAGAAAGASPTQQKKGTSSAAIDQPAANKAFGSSAAEKKEMPAAAPVRGGTEKTSGQPRQAGGLPPTPTT